MGKIFIGIKPIPKKNTITKLIRCCSCKKEYDFKGNIFKHKKDNILVCPHCGFKHKIDFTLFDNRIDKLKRVNRLDLVAIDIGTSAINRNAALAHPKTIILKANPANATGRITQIQVYSDQGFTNLQIGIFDKVGTNQFTTRSYHNVGAIGSGYREITVNLDVEAGDYIGCFYDGYAFEITSGGTDGYWYKTGDYIPCTATTFTSKALYAFSLYGVGITIPDPPTNVQATDGAYTDKVQITWTKSDGATAYQVYRDGTPLGWLGDVATYDDTGADAPTITPGSALASDGEYTEHVALSLSGQSVSYGTVHVYKVRAKNAVGESEDSLTDTGFRGKGTLTYQWQRSAADSDANYSNINGATTPSYNDTEAPADGSGRYYRCVINATGASQQISTSDRGYRLFTEFEYVGTGTFAYSGTADQIYSKNYLFEGSGELAFSGDAVIIFGLAFVGSGSLAYSGEAVVTYTRDYLSTAIGELIYSGEAIFSYLCNFLFSGSGELAYSGVAEQSYTYNFSHEADGSFTFSGEGTYTLGFAYTSSGEFTYSGEATQVYTKIFSTTGTGSFNYSGTGSYEVGLSYTGSGSLAYSGTVTQVYTTDFLYTASGEFTYSGAAICEYTIVGVDFEYVGSGQFVFSGTAPQSYTKIFSYTGSGDLTYSGEATISYTLNHLYTASGDLTFSGSAISIVGFTCVGSGAYNFGGTGLDSLGLSYIGSGSFVYSGEATQDYTVDFVYVSSGEFVYSGTAICIYEGAYIYEYVGSGLFIYSGEAICILVYNFLYATLMAIYANESVLSVDVNESVLSVFCNESTLSIYKNESDLSIYGNESILSIEE